MQEGRENCFLSYLGLTGGSSQHFSIKGNDRDKIPPAILQLGVQVSAMLSKSKGLVRAPREWQSAEPRREGGQLCSIFAPLPHSGRMGITIPRNCFPGTEIVGKGGVRRLGLPHTAFPWAFWVRILMRLLITSYLCISLQDLSLDVFTACTPIISFGFQGNSEAVRSSPPFHRRGN